MNVSGNSFRTTTDIDSARRYGTDWGTGIGRGPAIPGAPRNNIGPRLNDPNIGIGLL